MAFFFIWAVVSSGVECSCFKSQCHHREPPNQVSHLEGSTGDRKLVCDRPFPPLLRIWFAVGTKPYLCIIERNSPTPVRRRFSLTQKGLDMVIPGGGEEPGDGINVWRREVFSDIFHISLMIRPESCSCIGLI